MERQVIKNMIRNRGEVGVYKGKRELVRDAANDITFGEGYKGISPLYE
jgi:hypothetical protein